MKLISIITAIAYLICILTPCGVTAGNFPYDNNCADTDYCKSIPAAYGRIFDTNIQNTEQPDIIIINDLHCEPEAQKNISNLLRYLGTNFSLGCIFTEGAPAGKIDLSALREIYPDDTRKKVLNKMLEDGLLSGAEYYGSVNKNAILYGIEPWDIYITNIKIFKKLKLEEKYILRNLSIVEKIIERQKYEFYTKDMFLYDEIYGKNAKRNYENFIKLKKLADLYAIDINKNYPNIQKFIEILDLEKMNFNCIKKDSELLSQTIKKQLPMNSYINFQKKNNMKNAEETLISLYTNAKPFLNDYEIQKYKYVEQLRKKYQLTDLFNFKNFLCEEKILKEELFNKIFKKEEIRKTALSSRMLDYLKDYASLEMTFEDLKEFNEKKENIPDIFKTNTLNDIYIQNLMNNQLFSDYYKNNLKRSVIFSSVIKNNMQKEKINILVTGGFHNNITDLLNEAGLKYIVIMPNTKTTDKKQYKNILMNINTTYDALSDGLLVSGISKYKQEYFLLTWIKELRHNGLKDKEIIKTLNDWANSHKKFFSHATTLKSKIDLSDIVLTSNKFSIKGWLLKIKKSVLYYFQKLKLPFTYKYDVSPQKYSDVKEMKDMESNIKYFPFIQLMLGFDLYSSFSTIFIQSNGYSLEFIALIFSILAPVSFFSSAITGFIGDKISKRTVIVISLLIHTIGTVCFAVSGLSPVLLTASQILPVIGISGLNVSLSPFLFKSLERLGEKESFKELYGSNLALFWIIMSASSLLGGLIAFFTNQITVISIAALLDIACLIGAMIFTHKEKVKSTKHESAKKEKFVLKGYLNDILSPFSILLSNKKPLLLASFNIIVNNVFFVIFCFFLQPSFVAGGLHPVFLAPIYFTANILQSVASNFISRINNIADNNRHRTIFFITVGIVFSAFIITNNPLFLFLVYISMNFWQGTSSLTEISAVYEVLGENMRSKWLAFKSMAGTITASVTQILISCLLSAGISSNSLIAAGISLLIGTSIVLPKILDKERKGFIDANKIPNITNIRALLYSA